MIWLTSVDWIPITFAALLIPFGVFLSISALIDLAAQFDEGFK